MPFATRSSNQKGFSLIELLIVILIISIVYFLGFDGIDMGKPKPKALTPLTLKSTIASSAFFAGEGTFMCIDKCRSCYFRQGVSEPFEAYEAPIDLGKMEAYILSEEEELLRLDYGRYQDEKICLLIDFYSNGSSTQLILKDEKASYFLPAFFGEPQQFDAIEEAKTYWLRNAEAVSNSGDFY